MVILETERLRLREFALNDTLFIIELLNSPGWLKFIGDRNVRTQEEAQSYLQEGPLTSYRENGFGLWMVERKSDTLAIGMCGILRRKALEHPDIGFAFLPAFHGNGYAFEAASATLRLASETLNIPALSAITLADNVKSICLLEKNGFKFIKPFCLPERDEVLQLYSRDLSSLNVKV